MRSDHTDTATDAMLAPTPPQQTEGLHHLAANSERVLSLDLLGLYELPEREFWIDIGRWLDHTPPRLAQGLSAGRYKMCVAISPADGDQGQFNANLVQLFLDSYLPDNVPTRIGEDGRPGQVMVEIRRVA